MKTKSNHAAVAAIARKEIKRLGIKGTATGRMSGGSDAVTVTAWDISPIVARELATFCRRYELGTFDGIDDCYRYDNRDPSIPQVRYCSVVTCIGDSLEERIFAYCARTYEAMQGASWYFRSGAYLPELGCYAGQLVRRVYDGRIGDFWPAQLR